MAEVKARRPWRVPTGQFIRSFLLEHGESHPSEIHKALHEEYDKINQGRKRGERLTDKGRAEPPHEAWFNWRQLWLLEGYPALE